MVEITVPDGCFEGMEFTVEFEGRQFNIDSRWLWARRCHSDRGASGRRRAGRAAASLGSAAATTSTPAAELWQQGLQQQQRRRWRHFRVSLAEQLEQKARIRANKGVQIDGKRQTAAGEATWNTEAGTLFEMNPSEGAGRRAGDFHIGQLVQVTRTNGQWTYGKVSIFGLGLRFEVCRSFPHHVH